MRNAHYTISCHEFGGGFSALSVDREHKLPRTRQMAASMPASTWPGRRRWMMMMDGGWWYKPYLTYYISCRRGSLLLPPTEVSRTDGVAAALRSCDSRPDKLRLALRRKGWSDLLLGGFLLGGERSR
ncbi:hypothetical protein VTJ04DRAFT_6703 [Mycothermus thermophilus]|uniref:uncharacterized protein n=1 Tax=Humicola insolens TaxID=85995 RepID=UPI00374238F2